MYYFYRPLKFHPHYYDVCSYKQLFGDFPENGTLSTIFISACLKTSGIKSYPLGTLLLHYHIPCDVTCCFQIFESTPISIAKFESTQNNPSTSTTLIN